jgi:hypothetical protein
MPNLFWKWRALRLVLKALKGAYSLMVKRPVVIRKIKGSNPFKHPQISPF